MATIKMIDNNNIEQIIGEAATRQDCFAAISVDADNRGIKLRKVVFNNKKESGEEIEVEAINGFIENQFTVGKYIFDLSAEEVDASDALMKEQEEKEEAEKQAALDEWIGQRVKKKKEIIATGVDEADVEEHQDFEEYSLGEQPSEPLHINISTAVDGTVSKSYNFKKSLSRAEAAELELK